MSGRQHKVMVQPINVIFRHLQQQSRVSLWLYDNTDFRIEGKIIVRAFPLTQGFDEFMNVTLAEAEEVRCTPGKERKELGTFFSFFDDQMLTLYLRRCATLLQDGYCSRAIISYVHALRHANPDADPAGVVGPACIA